MNGGTFESQLNWAWVRILSEKIIVQVFPRDADYEAQHSVPGTTKTHRNCKSQKKEKKKKTQDPTKHLYVHILCRVYGKWLVKYIIKTCN